MDGASMTVALRHEVTRERSHELGFHIRGNSRDLALIVSENLVPQATSL
jgi:hypothetical protein